MTIENRLIVTGRLVASGISGYAALTQYAILSVKPLSFFARRSESRCHYASHRVDHEIYH